MDWHRRWRLETQQLICHYSQSKCRGDDGWSQRTGANDARDSCLSDRSESELRYVCNFSGEREYGGFVSSADRIIESNIVARFFERVRRESVRFCFSRIA